MTRITGTIHEDHDTLLLVSRLFLIRLRNVSDKSCKETQNTHFKYNNFYFENRAFKRSRGKLL